MQDYSLEAKRATQEATITVGSTPDYNSKRAPPTLDDVLRIVDGAHYHCASIHNVPLWATVFAGHLSGRTSNSTFHEPIYKVNITTNLRTEPVENEHFLTVATAFATYLGTELDQSYVFLEHKGTTYVLKHPKEID